MPCNLHVNLWDRFYYASSKNRKYYISASSGLMISGCIRTTNVLAQKNRTLFFHRSRGQKSKFNVSTGSCSSGGSREESFLASLDLWWLRPILGVPSLWQHHSNLCLHLHVASVLCLSVSTLLARTPVRVDLGTMLISRLSPHYYDHKDSIPKPGHLLRFRVDANLADRRGPLFNPLPEPLLRVLLQLSRWVKKMSLCLTLCLQHGRFLRQIQNSAPSKSK